MTRALRIALAQINPIVGDIAGNQEKIRIALKRGAELAADLVVTPECALCGYAPEDWVLRPQHQRLLEDHLERLAAQMTPGGPGLIVGLPLRHQGKLYNAAVLLEAGRAPQRIFKHELPNYGPFDEKRLYASAPLGPVLHVRGHALGVMICEDMWFPAVAASLKQQGAVCLLVMNASPYETHKPEERRRIARQRVQETGVPLLNVNLVGGQDNLVFDGASFAMDAAGEITLQAPAWEEGVFCFDLNSKSTVKAPLKALPPADAENDYRALETALRDYVQKNGFKSVLLGLSGGVDSALVATLAADALGPQAVHAVMMPSPYTSDESVRDAEALAKNLGIHYSALSIRPAMELLSEQLAPHFVGKPADVTEENLQSRLRGLMLMALSNKHGYLLLATGNKSEFAMGYATLYGDMCGGFAPIKDVYKTRIYALASWRNAQGAVIPENILTRAPSAELRPNQTDQDTLPPYDALDEILEGLIERDEDIATVAKRGHDEALVCKIWKMLNRAEYKRRQAPPGPKITRRDLTRDRRYPITQRG